MKVILIKTGALIRCRACKTHVILLPRWKYNENPDKPTFSPSINETCNSPDHPSYQPQAKTSKCHFTVTDGKIQYHSDCLHDLKNQILELEDWSQEQVDFYKNSPGYH